MKIPGYICVLACCLAFGLTYWLGSRSQDFITPPEGYEDKTVEDLVKSLPQPKPKPKKAPPVEVKPQPKPEPEDEQVPVELAQDAHPSDFIDQKEGGAEGYIALAEKLVQQDKQEHSLVAWERVLDSAEPNQEQVKRAFDLLKMHKVISREEVNGIAISIKLHASVPGDLIAKMEKILSATAAVIEAGAGYSVNVATEVSVVAVGKGRPRPPVTIWFSGKNESPRASFRTKSSRELGLDAKVNGFVFNIVSPFLREHSTLTPLEESHNEVNASDTLQFLITRHSWRQFGLLLYQDLNQEKNQ